MATFQERFNMLYEKSNLSQKEFGSIFGASTDSKMMKKIAESCNVSVDWLVGKSHIRTPITITAARRTNISTDDLPPEAEERIQEFIELMRLKYGKKSK